MAPITAEATNMANIQVYVWLSKLSRKEIVSVYLTKRRVCVQRASD